MRSSYTLLASCYGSRRDYRRLLRKLQTLSSEDLASIRDGLDSFQDQVLRRLLSTVYLG